MRTRRKLQAHFFWPQDPEAERAIHAARVRKHYLRGTAWQRLCTERPRGQLQPQGWALWPTSCSFATETASAFGGDAAVAATAGLCDCARAGASACAACYRAGVLNFAFVCL